MGLLVDLLRGDSMAEIRADGIDVVGCREGKHEKDSGFLSIQAA